MMPFQSGQIQVSFGVVDHSRISRSFESLDELKDHLEIGKGRLNWIWTPESDRLVAPEEIPKLAGSLKKRCLIFAAEDEGLCPAHDAADWELQSSTACFAF
jgi:hypothetical protein